MKKIFRALKDWVTVGRKNKVEAVVEAGGFIVTFKTFDMTIETISKNFFAKFAVSEHPYTYLYVAATMENFEQIHGYCLYLYKTAMSLTTDQGFVDDLTKSIKKLDKRILKAAKTAVKQTNPEDDSQALREAQRIIELAEMTEEERRVASDALMANYKLTKDE